VELKNWIVELERNDKNVSLRLQNPAHLNTDLFSCMEADSHSLPALLADAASARLVYSVADKISLRDFLASYVFEKEEGYLFLSKLFESAISTNRNKPVLFSPDYVFVSSYGDEFYFVVLPMQVEQWMYQKDLISDWVQFILEAFQTTSAYEIPGYLLLFLKSPEFSLPALISGLEGLRRKYYPKKLFKKNLSAFRTKEAIRPLSQKENIFFESESTGISEPQPERMVSKMAVVPEMPEVIEQEKTMLIGQSQRAGAWLELENERYDLLFENMIVGRSMQCDIRLQQASISLQHAKISCDAQRYYIQDLRSSNHTYLNDKQVIRKMRLKDGFLVRFGDVEMTFCQP
jgi:hypothetical protein